jgi:hypothetical protein
MEQLEERWLHGRRSSRISQSEKGSLPWLYELAIFLTLFKTKRILVNTRLNPIVNRLTKTRTEIPPPESSQHLRDEKEAHQAAKRKVLNEAESKRRKEEARLTKERREMKERNAADWDALVGSSRVEEEGVSNEDGWNEDDFM